MNSESLADISLLICETAYQLCDEWMVENIDRPIEQVLQSFRFDYPEWFTQGIFLEIIGRFIQQINLDGLRLKRTLTLAQACSEAIELLNGYHSISGATEYEAALCDATAGEQGLWFVLQQIATMIRSQQHSIHARSIQFRFETNLTWHQRRTMVESWLQFLGPALPLPLSARPIAELAHHWNDVLQLCLDDERFLNALASKVDVFQPPLKLRFHFLRSISPAA